MICNPKSEKVPRLFHRFGRLSTKSLSVATCNSLSTMTLCECKIASTSTHFCVALDRSQISSRLAQEIGLLRVALVAPAVSTIFLMVTALLIMTLNSLQYCQNELVPKIQTWWEELTAHWVAMLFQHHQHRPTEDHHTPSRSFRRLLISAGVALPLKSL